MLTLAAPAAAGDALERILQATTAASGRALPSRAELIAACRADLLCSARRLVEALGPAARLLPAAHPDSDTIRWVATRPSLRVQRRDGALEVTVLRLGRKVLQELRDVFDQAPRDPAYVLDLRQLQGGGFARMLEVASFFLGPRQEALALVGPDRTTWLDLPAPTARGARPATVRIGAATASAGEVLAALLVAHGDAALCGSASSAGAAALKAVIPVDHDWRLLVERARIEVPAVDLRHGLHPDRPC